MFIVYTWKTDKILHMFLPKQFISSTFSYKHIFKFKIFSWLYFVILLISHRKIENKEKHLSLVKKKKRKF